MYFSKAIVNVQRSADTARLHSRGGYQLHKEVWKLFPGQDRREFLYRRLDKEALPTLYLLSREEPKDELGAWVLSVKPYQPVLSVGDSFAFSLRANPVISRKGPAGGRGLRHDVVMDAKKRSATVNQRVLEQDVGSSWLERRAEQCGFNLRVVQVEGYQQHVLRKSENKQIKFSTLDFTGVLTVTDSSKLLNALTKGIGSAKGFGCGMLMIKPLVS